MSQEELAARVKEVLAEKTATSFSSPGIDMATAHWLFPFPEVSLQVEAQSQGPRSSVDPSPCTLKPQTHPKFGAVLWRLHGPFQQERET